MVKTIFSVDLTVKCRPSHTLEAIIFRATKVYSVIKSSLGRNCGAGARLRRVLHFPGSSSTLSFSSTISYIALSPRRIKCYEICKFCGRKRAWIKINNIYLKLWRFTFYNLISRLYSAQYHAFFSRNFMNFLWIFSTATFMPHCY